MPDGGDGGDGGGGDGVGTGIDADFDNPDVTSEEGGVIGDPSGGIFGGLFDAVPNPTTATTREGRMAIALTPMATPANLAVQGLASTIGSGLGALGFETSGTEGDTSPGDVDGGEPPPPPKAIAPKPVPTPLLNAVPAPPVVDLEAERRARELALSEEKKRREVAAAAAEEAARERAKTATEPLKLLAKNTETPKSSRFKTNPLGLAGVPANIFRPTLLGG